MANEVEGKPTRGKMAWGQSEGEFHEEESDPPYQVWLMDQVSSEERNEE